MARGQNRGVCKDLHFFSYPKNPVIRAVWLEKSGRKDAFNPENGRVCSEHFLPEDFDPSYFVKKKLMPATRATLRKDVVPSQRLPSQMR